MKAIVGLFIAIPLASLPGFSQAGPTGQISGRVTDPSAAVLPGVEVKVTQTDTGLVRTAVSNESGVFTLPTLPVGPYKLEASLPGFRSFVQTGIVLQVNANLVMDAVLQVGEVSQTVEVQANAELQVETRSMSVGTMMERERILELPLSARKVTDLVVLTGAAVQTGQSPVWGMNTGVNISAAGGRGFSVGYSLDGSLHTNRFDATNMPLPFPDALQEFRVNTGTQDSGTARSSGASVSSVTKAGTNSIHGDAFWYVRNAVFNAQQASAISKDQLKRNQFGGTVGGPILHNKLFFFAGYQGTEERNTPSGTLSIVPTAAILRGDWTAFNKCFSPRWNDADLARGSIDPARYSRAALLLSAKLPQAQDDCGNIRWGNPVHNSEKQIVERVDYQRSANQSFFGRYFTVMQDSPVPYNTSNLLTAGNPGTNDTARMLVGGHTWVVNPNTVNTARVTYNRITVVKPGPQFFSPSDVGINAYTSAPGHFSFSATGFFSFGSGNGGAGRHLWQGQYQVGDDVTLTRGTHQLAFGGTWSRDNWVNVAHARSAGVTTVDGTATGSTGNVLGDFMLGKIGQIRQAMPEAFSQYQHYFGFYGQDTWRATSRLTVNYGVRWEPFIPPVWYSDEKNPLGGFQTYRFSVDAYRDGTKSTVFPTAPAGFLYPSQKPDGSGPADFPERSGVPSDWTKIGPRVGFAWDPTGKGQTSLRAGYSLAYDVVNLQVILNAAGVSPWAGDTLYRNGTLDNPWQGLAGGNPFPFDWRTTPRYVDSSVFLPFSKNLQSTYAQSWNFSLQQQFNRRWLVSASYLGSLTPHLWSTAAVNGAVYLTPQSYPTLFTATDTCVLEGRSYSPCNQTGNINQRRELRLWAAMNKPSLLSDAALFSNVDEFHSESTANYNAMLLSVRGEFRGITVNANHTWSHCISDRANDGVPNPNGTFQRGRDRANCTSDRRHIFNFTAVASAPHFENKWFRAVASDWKLSGIYRVSSGSYLTISSGVDRALTGLATQTADQIASNVYTDGPIGLGSLFLNKSAFVAPALGSYGNMTPLSIRGLGSWNLDASLSRAFRLKEKQQFEFRAEAFNLTNAVRPNNPNTSLNNVNFGKITSVDQPRIMQFALKYGF
jgi:hypothetical protein